MRLPLSPCGVERMVVDVAGLPLAARRAADHRAPGSGSAARERGPHATTHADESKRGNRRPLTDQTNRAAIARMLPMLGDVPDQVLSGKSNGALTDGRLRCHGR